MSAENAWRIAMEAAARLALVPPQGDLEHDMACEAHGRGIAHDIECLPMPPAFRAEVEAEAEELREALGRIRDETLMGVSHGLGDRIYSIASGALSRLEAKGESHE